MERYLNPIKLVALIVGAIAFVLDDMAKKRETSLLVDKELDKRFAELKAQQEKANKKRRAESMIRLGG